MAGEDVAGFFSDLEAREPTLPPHLERARKSGAAIG
jgi:hydrogenase expression/formation protein HypC